MSALECPCQSKVGGVLHDSSMLASQFRWTSGGEVPLVREKKQQHRKNGVIFKMDFGDFC